LSDDPDGVFDQDKQEPVKPARRGLADRFREGVARARGIRMPRPPRAVRVVFAWFVLLVGVVFLVGAGMELAASGTINRGVSIDGIEVGGMSRADAEKAVQEKVKILEGDVQLVFEGKQYPVAMESIGCRVDVDGMVRDAYLNGKRGPAVVRVFKRLCGIATDRDVPVKIVVNKTRLKTRITTIAREVDRDPTSASISVSTGSPKIVASRQGVRVRIDDTANEVVKALPTTRRQVDMVVEMVDPEVVEGDINKVVVIHQKQFTLYLFDREEEINSYKIAVGMPQYPTPNGRYHITYKEKNPTWLPTSEWAKDKQGIPQPPGPDNPLGGYWMDIGGGLGIHATPYPKSLGEQASHGCIRMSEYDAANLFNQVNVGTPVFIID
jgi:lipoprotein-anchoring transpeptidase ErfK/SrfK